MGRLALLTAAALACVCASTAHADPCKVIPDRGPMPSFLHRGAVFAGPVGAVLDGDSLCVAGAGGLIEVRLADLYAVELNEPGGREAKARASRALMGRTLVCTAGRRSYDRVVASCTLNGQPVGEVLRRAGVQEGGRGVR